MLILYDPLMKKVCPSAERFLNVSGIIFIFLIVRPESPSVKAEKWRRNSAAREFALSADYFIRKDLQSVHWSMVGLASWVPTWILSREQ